MKVYRRIIVIIGIVGSVNSSSKKNIIDDAECGLHSTNFELAQTRSAQEPADYVTLDHRLIGGSETHPHAWPWTVQLLSRLGQHRCGGSLIDANFVLTAAHCFAKDRRPTSYSVRVGGHRSGSGSPHRVTAVSIHPWYNIGFPSSYDFAIMRIHPPVNASTIARPICLPSLPAVENRLCIVTGWGSTIEGSAASAPTLREIHVPLLSTLFCSSLPNYVGRIHLPSMLCAGYSYGRIDSCQGDSGGPLMCARDGHWELTGVVSWGIGCARPGMPGVYGNVNAASTWINLEMNRLRI